MDEHRDVLLNPDSWFHPSNAHGEGSSRDYGYDPAWEDNFASLARLLSGESNGYLALTMHHNVRIPGELWELDALRTLNVTIVRKSKDDPHNSLNPPPGYNPMVGFDDQNFNSTFDIMQGILISKSMTSLRVDGIRMIDGYSGIALTDSLLGNTDLVDLTLIPMKIDERDPRDDIAEALISYFERRSDTFIKALGISVLDLPDHGDTRASRRLVDMIRNGYTGIETLRLSLDTSEAGVYDILSNLIANNRTLRELDLSGSNLYDAGLIKVFQGMVLNTALKTLRVSDTNGGNTSPISTSAYVLMEALRRNDTLSILYIDGVMFSEDAFDRFMERLKSNETLRALFIGGSSPGTGDAGMKIGRMLSENHSLAVLDISKTQFSLAEARALRVGASENSGRNPGARGITMLVVSPSTGGYQWVDTFFPRRMKMRSLDVYMTNAGGGLDILLPYRE